MPTGPAARVTDKVAHPLPGMLAGSPGSPTVFIGNLPAWRGLPLAAAAALQSAQATALASATAAEATAVAAAATPGGPAARAAAEATKAALLASMSSAISAAAAGGTDIHNCNTFPLMPMHGPGVVITGSPTVMINNMPACRLGDTILEAIGPPDLIIMGCMTVIIGDMGGAGSSGMGGSGSASGLERTGGGGATPSTGGPSNEPTSLEDCKKRLEAAKAKIAATGYQPKYTDAQIEAMAKSDGPSPRFVVNCTFGPLDETKPIGQTVDGLNRFWSAPFDQVEDADLDPYLIAAKLGIPEEKVKSGEFTIAIIDTHAPVNNGGQTVVPTYKNLGDIATREVAASAGLSEDEIRKVLTPEYSETYAKLDADYRASCEENGKKAYSPKALKEYVEKQPWDAQTKRNFTVRRTIETNLGPNAKFSGDGMTKQLKSGNVPPGSKPNQRHGACETLTINRNPPKVKDAKESGGMIVISI